MMKKISDAAPAAFLSVASVAVLAGFLNESMALQRIEEVLPWPWSVAWLISLLAGAMAVLLGVSFRSRKGKHGKLQDIGQALELGGYPLVGGALIAYDLVLLGGFPLGRVFLSVCFMLALASAFLGPWLVLIRDLVRAWRYPKA